MKLLVSERPALQEAAEQVTLSMINLFIIIKEISTDSLKGRIVSSSLADLKQKSDNLHWFFYFFFIKNMILLGEK